MVRRKTAADARARVSANPPQIIPAGPVRADFDVMMPGYPRRHDGWNQKRLQRFLDALCHTGCVEDASRLASMSTVASRRAAAKYPAFAAAWQAALTYSQPHLIAVAYQRAVEGRETIIIRKGEEHERKIEPSDSMLRLLLNRGDNVGAGSSGLDPDQVLTFAEWEDGVTFDARGGKISKDVQEAEAAKFIAKMNDMRRRVAQNAKKTNRCITCEQPLASAEAQQRLAEHFRSNWD